MTAPQGNIQDLELADILFSGSQSGLCLLNPDGSSLANLSVGTFIPGKNSDDVKRSSYRYSNSVPSQIGIVGLNS